MSFIDTVPIEKDASFESNWTTYIACVVAACAADGLSAAEKSAIQAVIDQHDAAAAGWKKLVSR